MRKKYLRYNSHLRDVYLFHFTREGIVMLSMFFLPLVSILHLVTVQCLVEEGFGSYLAFYSEIIPIEQG